VSPSLAVPGRLVPADGRRGPGTPAGRAVVPRQVPVGRPRTAVRCCCPPAGRGWNSDLARRGPRLHPHRAHLPLPGRGRAPAPAWSGQRARPL